MRRASVVVERDRLVAAKSLFREECRNIYYCTKASTCTRGANSAAITYNINSVLKTLFIFYMEELTAKYTETTRPVRQQRDTYGVN